MEFAIVTPWTRITRSHGLLYYHHYYYLLYKAVLFPITLYTVANGRTLYERWYVPIDGNLLYSWLISVFKKQSFCLFEFPQRFGSFARSTIDGTTKSGRRASESPVSYGGSGANPPFLLDAKHEIATYLGTLGPMVV
jgi:hypothetical protein